MSRVSSPRRSLRPLAALAMLASLGAGCGKKAEKPQSTATGERSPNASILPAPLASGADLEPRPRNGVDDASAFAGPDAAEGPPRPLREDDAPDRDSISGRDATGATLEASFRWYDLASPPPGSEVDAEGIKEARQKTPLTVSIDLAFVGRMRLVLTSGVFPLPYNSELRARHDRYGHLLIWPDGNSFRVVPKGGLRAIFVERRADVAPLVEAKVGHADTGTLLGMVTQKIELSTQLAQVTLEQTALTAAGTSGELLCRLLLELAGAAPTSSVCSEQMTPLRAEFRWTDHGRIAFEVTSVTKRTDLPMGLLYTPPLGATFKPGEFPPESSGIFLTRQHLSRFRSKDVRRPPSPSDKGPAEGIVAVNRTDTLYYLMLDGIPVAWVRPHSEKYVIGPRPGRYLVSWRDFLGSEAETRKTVELPARVVVGREEEPKPTRD